MHAIAETAITTSIHTDISPEDGLAARMKGSGGTGGARATYEPAEAQSTSVLERRQHIHCHISSQPKLRERRTARSISLKNIHAS